MQIAIIGTIREKDEETLTVFDHRTKDFHTVYMQKDKFAEAAIGDQGIFMGELEGDRIRVERFDLRKILEPLYEEDLFEKSGVFTLIAPIDNPFPKFYAERYGKNDEPTDTTT